MKRWEVTAEFKDGGAMTWTVKACCKTTAEDKGRTAAKLETSQTVLKVSAKLCQ